MRTFLVLLFLLLSSPVLAADERAEFHCIMHHNVLHYPDKVSTDGRLWTFRFEADWDEVRFKPGGYFSDMVYEVTGIWADRIEAKKGNAIFVYYDGKFYSTLTSHLFIASSSGDCMKVANRNKVKF